MIETISFKNFIFGIFIQEKEPWDVNESEEEPDENDPLEFRY